MITWVLYDIENDKSRTLVARYCKQSGMYRVQLSVFLGMLNQNEKDTLALKISPLINEAKDKVYIFPMTKEEMGQSILLGQAFDRKLVTDKIKQLFF